MQNLEQLNRENFKSLMDALAMPGSIHEVKPLFDSKLLAIANVLLYSEVSYFYNGSRDMTLIEAITNPKQTSSELADYIFSDALDEELIKQAKRGDHVNPDFSATLIMQCEKLDHLPARLSGPGIDGKKSVLLPCDASLIDTLRAKNSDYPLGVELFFIDNTGNLMALSRTTQIEVG
jgi:alpha-D-ribose 1-methylphosphonate 5-triphosphate synthase subunit PhnH